MATKYEKWLKKDNLLLLNGWKRSGLSDEQMAKNMGISRRTYYNWQSRFPEIKKVTTLGHEHANFMVENALFKKAINGNVTAMIFWLKNNMRDRYSDTQRSELEDKLTATQIEKVKLEMEIERKKSEFLNDTQITQEDVIGSYFDTLFETAEETLGDDLENEINEDKAKG